MSGPVRVGGGLTVSTGGGMGRRRWWVSGAVAVCGTGLAILAGGLVGGTALYFQLDEIGVLVLFAVGVSFVLGVAGVAPFGNQLFYGAGAYAVAEGATRLGVGDDLLLLGLCVMAGVVMGFVVGIFLARVDGIAFGLLALALAQLGYLVAYQTNVVGGANGITGISGGFLFGLRTGTAFGNFVLTWCVVGVGAGLVDLLRRSRIGVTLRAVGDDGVRAEAIGTRVWAYKVFAFVVGAVVSAVAGGLLALNTGTVDSSSLYWTAGAVPLLAGMMGGVRSTLGPIVGAVVLGGVTVWLALYTESWVLVEGVLVVVVYLVWPEGVVGYAGRHRWNGLWDAVLGRVARAWNGR